ncbi:unnamed protein product, partial [marine sediment metagenome]
WSKMITSDNDFSSLFLVYRISYIGKKIEQIDRIQNSEE